MAEHTAKHTAENAAYKQERTQPMRLFTWTHHAALPLLMCVLLASCSVPDDSKPEGPSSQSTPPSAATETATEPAVTLSGPGQILPIVATAEMKGEIFELEVAQTREEQALGLMFRSALPDNRGMLFPFTSARRASFWMKDVPVPLDMVFLRNGEVIAIASEVPPCPSEPCPSYGPGSQLVDMVLELRSGRAAEISLQTGDTVIITPLPSD